MHTAFTTNLGLFFTSAAVPIAPQLALARVTTTPQLQQQQHTSIETEDVHKSTAVAYLLCVLLGFFGAHHFYLRRKLFGVAYLFTLGLLGIGWIVDIFRIPLLVRKANQKMDNPEHVEQLTKTDAYILWFPLGFLGFHQYYIRGRRWGITYSCTLGLFGVGWLVDGFRIPFLVAEANSLGRENPETSPRNVRLDDAYILGLSPAGIFGAHHFYMGNCCFGILYACSFGLFGQGWIVDWVRMYWLVERANHPDRHILKKRHKYLDDAYLLGAAVPFGILGFHHAYLERQDWFRLYLLTHGLCAIGWLVDLARMPCLVSDTNTRLEEEEEIRTRTNNAIFQITIQSRGAAEESSRGRRLPCINENGADSSTQSSRSYNVALAVDGRRVWTGDEISPPSDAAFEGRNGALAPPAYQDIFGEKSEELSPPAYQQCTQGLNDLQTQ